MSDEVFGRDFQRIADLHSRGAARVRSLRQDHATVDLSFKSEQRAADIGVNVRWMMVERVCDEEYPAESS